MPALQWNSLVAMTVFLLVFVVTGGVGFVLFLRAYGDRKRAISRLRNLADGAAPPASEKSSVGDLARTALPKIGTLLLPNKEDRLATLKQKLLQAGYYSPHALGIYLGVKLVLMLVLPMATAALPYLLGDLGLQRAVQVSVCASGAGMLLPGIWLMSRVKKRQALLRHALPDALDMLILCLEGGVSMTAAFQRVTGELQIVHPLLGAEMSIVQREIQLGLSTGEGLKKLGERCGLDDVRELASVLIQSERYGASVVKALRMHADTWRQERQSRAEETAHKAAVKILFPTMLCIFPAIFLVLLGPAALQIATYFSK
jgi:tight adherence protein C